MKKILPVFLTVSVLASLAACSDGGTVTDGTASGSDDAPTTEAVTEAPLTDGLPDVDMNGFLFRVYNNSKEKMTWTNTTLDVESLTGDILEDAIYNRNRETEARFNCVIEVQSTGNQISAAEIQKEVMAGDSNFDLWMPRDYHIVGAIPSLRPLDDLPYINLDAEWWFPQASEIFKFNGQQYGATSYFSLSPISRAAGIVFNEDLYANLGAEMSPYDYVREDKWTLATFYELCKLGVADLNGDGKMDDSDRWGFGSSWKEMWARFVNGSGVNFVEKTDDNYPTFSLPSDEAAIEKLLYIFETFNDPTIYNNPASNMDTEAVANIWDETALFALGHPNNMGGKYRNVPMNVGYLPCPKYDENQDRYYCTTWASEMMVILKTLPDERLENVSILLEALSFDSAQDDGVMQIYKEVMMKGKYATNENCEEMFDIVLNSLSFDFGIIAWEAEVVNPIIKDIYASRKGNVVSSLEKFTPTVEKKIATLIENIEGNA
ncbi:MAG: hypothetical protein IJ302_03540 [Clostridia bacterium]|nr:hypothetical protein [Clostridia bacterium]